MKPRLSFLLRIFLFLLALSLVIEILLRALSPQPLGNSRRAVSTDFGEIPVPDQKGSLWVPGVFRFYYHNNNEGLRGNRNYDAPAKTNERRILTLGDSFTYGIGVNDEETSSAVLERLIQDPAVVIVNAGNENTGTDYALRFLQLRSDRIKPQKALVFFHFSDFGNNVKSPIFSYNRSNDSLTVRNIRPNALKDYLNHQPIYNWLICHSHLAAFLKFKVLGGGLFSDDQGSAPFNKKYGYRTPLPDSIIAPTRALLRALKQEAQTKKIDLYFFYTPSTDDLIACRSRQITNRQQGFMQIADQLGLNWFTLTNAIANTPFSPKELYFADGHWTPIGHRIAAQTVYTLLQRDLETTPENRP